jgi:hypothetical protein
MAHEYVSKGIPFLRSLNIRRNSVDPTDLKFISAEFHAKLQKSRLSPSDVVSVRTGKPGVTAVVPSAYDTANCADLIVFTCGQNIAPIFLWRARRDSTSRPQDSQSAARCEALGHLANAAHLGSEGNRQPEHKDYSLRNRDGGRRQSLFEFWAARCRAASSSEPCANGLPTHCPNQSGFWAKFEVCSGTASQGGKCETNEKEWWARQGSNL